MVKIKFGKTWRSLKILWKWFQVPNFSINCQVRFFGPNLPKKGVSGLKQKNHHWILHIRISLGAKFQLKLRILGVFTKNRKKNKNCTCECVHGLYLLYETFSLVDRQTQRYFNVSSPYSRKDEKTPEAYLEPCLTSKNFFFCENS